MKILLKGLVSVMVLLLFAFVALVLLVDANSFKPRIEAAAKDQGIALEINGNLGWSFWPSIGVYVNDLSLAALAAPAEPIAKLQRASLLLELMPLFSGEFRVDHIKLDGVDINLRVDAKGHGNWEALTKPKPAAQKPQPDPADKAKAQSFKLNAQQISLTNSSLNYSDVQSGQTFKVHDLNLMLAEVNTQGAPFKVQLSWVLDLAQAGAEPMGLAGSLSNLVTLDETFTQIQLDGGEAEFEVRAKTNASLRLKYALILKDVQKNLSYKGKLQLTELNARKLLAAMDVSLDTAEMGALSDLTFAADFEGDTNQLALNNLQLKLDQTQFSGSFALKDIAKAIYDIQLQGDSINIDHYLPVPIETAATTPAAPPVDTPLPLEALRALNLNVRIELAQATLKKLNVSNFKLQLKAKNGQLQQAFTANAYQGDIVFNSVLDARPAQAQVKFDGAVTGLELAPLLDALALKAKVGLSGALQAKTQGTTQGVSVDQLIVAMDSSASFSGAQMRVSPINIEQQICKVVNLVQQADGTAQNWNEYTEMRELAGAIKWQNQIINIETFKAGVKQLQIGSTGQINLATDKYDFALPFQLIEAQQTSADVHSCLGNLTSSYWLQRSISLLRCKGSFSGLDPLKDCGPDKKALAELTKDFAEFKLREKHGAKIEEKKEELKEKVEVKKQEALQKLQEKIGGEGEVKKPKDLLNNFLKKKLGGESSAASSAVTSSVAATDVEGATAETKTEVVEPKAE